MTLVKELHKNEAIVDYNPLEIGNRTLLDIELVNLFDWFKDAGAVDIYMDYRDDMNLLYVIKSYCRYREIQTSTLIGKKAPSYLVNGGV